MPSKTKDPVIGLLLTFMEQAFDKKAWHGPTLRGALRGVTYKEALWRPSPKHHNIQELVKHCAYWKYAVRRRLTGEKRGSFELEGSNWFHRDTNGGADDWKRDIALLQKEHKLLLETVASLKSDKIRRMDMIYGIASHDLYHAGQIQLLKRLQRGGVVTP
jgi:uncharacterized damage-inducible protein DinB